MHAPLVLRPEWMDATKVFPHPQWENINQWVTESFPRADHHSVYTGLARDWVQQIATCFPGAMQVAESAHFLIAVREAKLARAYLDQLEFYLRSIRKTLAELHLEAWVGKSVVLVLPDEETFVRYLSDYYQDGEHMMPGGVCLNRGYVHFVLPDRPLAESASVLAHELCHVCVAHKNWPSWIDEAVAQFIENRLTQRAPYVLNGELIARHRRYWTADRLETFWSGKSFDAPDEGSELSYHLARFVLEAATSQGREAFFHFLRNAQHADSGFAAMSAAVGVSPAEVVANLLGEEATSEG